MTPHRIAMLALIAALAWSTVGVAQAQDVASQPALRLRVGPTKAPNFRLSPGYGEVAEDGEERPLAGRVAVVVVHGYGGLYMGYAGNLKATMTWSGFNGAYQAAHRADPQGTEAFKLHYYYYTPSRPYPVLAKEFADRLVERLLTGPDAASKVIFVAHSAGTLMSRYAAADPRIQPKVAGILTMAGIHRGSVQASLVAAKGLLDRPGVDREHMVVLNKLRAEAKIDPRVYAEDPDQRLACGQDPACAVVESIAFDNFDGSITEADQRDHGMLVNADLKAFNEADPNIARIHAYHGDVDSFGTRAEGSTFSNLFRRRSAPPPRQVPTDNEVERLAVTAINPSWANADPMVTFESGTFQGARCDLGGCHTYPNVSHKDILFDSAVQKQVVADLIRLAKLARKDQADEFFRAVRGAVTTAAQVTRRVVARTGLFGLGGE